MRSSCHLFVSIQLSWLSSLIFQAYEPNYSLSLFPFVTDFYQPPRPLIFKAYGPYESAMLSVFIYVCLFIWSPLPQFCLRLYSPCCIKGKYAISCKIWGVYGGDYEECRLLGYKNPVRTSQETHYVSATKSSQLMLCKIWGFHGGDYEECRFLGYKTPVRTSQETHYVSATESSQLMLCKIWGFYGGDYEECCLQWYKTQFLPHRRHFTSPLQIPAG
jgi:hypothetical protein